MNQTILWFVRCYSHQCNVPLVAANFSHIVRPIETHKDMDREKKHEKYSYKAFFNVYRLNLLKKCSALQLLNIWHLIVSIVAFHGGKFMVFFSLKNNIKHHKYSLVKMANVAVSAVKQKVVWLINTSLLFFYSLLSPLNSKLNTSDESLYFELAILKRFFFSHSVFLLQYGCVCCCDVFLVCCAYKSSVSERRWVTRFGKLFSQKCCIRDFSLSFKNIG